MYYLQCKHSIPRIYTYITKPSEKKDSLIHAHIIFMIHCYARVSIAIKFCCRYLYTTVVSQVFNFPTIYGFKRPVTLNTSFFPYQNRYCIVISLVIIRRYSVIVILNSFLKCYLVSIQMSEIPENVLASSMTGYGYTHRRIRETSFYIY